MKEDQLEQLLRHRTLIEAPQGMKVSILSQLPDREQTQSVIDTVLPE